MAIAPNPNAPKIRVNMSLKVNLGNFQNIQIDAGMYDLPFDADEAMLATAQQTMKEIMDRSVANLRDEVAVIRMEAKWWEEDAF